MSPQLAMEAIFVGGTLIPVWLTVRNLLKDAGEPLQILVTGASYHLISEWVGLNSYFLENSHAANKKYSDLVSTHYDMRGRGFDFYHTQNMFR